MKSHRNGQEILVCDVCHEPCKNMAGKFKKRAQVEKEVEGEMRHFHKLCWELGGETYRPSQPPPMLRMTRIKRLFS